MEGDSLSLIIILFCIVMSAYFSATETAFSSLNRIRVKNMAEKGNKRAQLVLNMSEDYGSLLSTILIGNNIVNILCSSLATVLFISMLGQEAGPTVATVVVTVVVLIFGEITPKTVAKESPEKFAMFAAPILRAFVFVLTPANILFGLWKKLISKLFKADDNRGITEEELITIVEEAEQEGGLDEEESTLIRSAIEFSDVEVKDIHTPRIHIEGVSENADKEEIARMFTETGYSRLPVYRDSLDHIVGVIYHKDFHNYVYNTNAEVSSIIRPAIFVTPNKKIDELLKELQQQKSHIAFILDEYAGTLGLVTLEDIVEELVGDIWDEHDEIIQSIVPLSKEEYEVLGSADIEELFEELDINRDIDVMTASGWVMNELGRIPAVDDSFEYENLYVTVLEMDENRVGKIRIVVKPY